jgi:hypothetical protein
MGLKEHFVNLPITIDIHLLRIGKVQFPIDEMGIHHVYERIIWEHNLFQLQDSPKVANCSNSVCIRRPLDILTAKREILEFLNGTERWDALRQLASALMVLY